MSTCVCLSVHLSVCGKKYRWPNGGILAKEEEKNEAEEQEEDEEKKEVEEEDTKSTQTGSFLWLEPYFLNV